MWLCTKLGFYSIVAKTPTEVHIRARAKKDLENLRRKAIARVPGASAWKIHRTEPADYRFRIVIHASDLPAVMQALAASIDYSNFKAVIHKTADQRDKGDVYWDFHTAMEHHQTLLKE